MLFKQIHLTGIKEGKINLAFRKWKKPAVKKGSLIKTAIGQVEIVDIVEVKLNDITSSEASKAGFELEDLQKQLKSIEEGTIYKITIRYHSEDPRLQLRSQSKLSHAEFEKIKNKLQRLDAHSKQGSWTMEVLKLIQDNPELRAGTLAMKMDREKDWLKINIRKLKNLGLTISHEVGYTLSPLGIAFLEWLTKR